ncbi:MAG: hypothetical protein HY911_12665 [Desulfobacterales bacterium]|nr:hypothetical protein [Desulfobacterales bacterium]
MFLMEHGIAIAQRPICLRLTKNMRQEAGLKEDEKVQIHGLVAKHLEDFAGQLAAF